MEGSGAGLRPDTLSVGEQNRERRRRLTTPLLLNAADRGQALGPAPPLLLPPRLDSPGPHNGPSGFCPRRPLKLPEDDEGAEGERNSFLPPCRLGGAVS